eukprot:gene2949-3391_t
MAPVRIKLYLDTIIGNSPQLTNLSINVYNYHRVPLSTLKDILDHVLSLVPPTLTSFAVHSNYLGQYVRGHLQSLLDMLASRLPNLTNLDLSSDEQYMVDDSATPMMIQYLNNNRQIKRINTIGVQNPSHGPSAIGEYLVGPHCTIDHISFGCRISSLPHVTRHIESLSLMVFEDKDVAAEGYTSSEVFNNLRERLEKQLNSILRDIDSITSFQYGARLMVDQENNSFIGDVSSEQVHELHSSYPSFDQLYKAHQANSKIISPEDLEGSVVGDDDKPVVATVERLELLFDQYSVLNNNATEDLVAAKFSYDEALYNKVKEDFKNVYELEFDEYKEEAEVTTEDGASGSSQEVQFIRSDAYNELYVIGDKTAMNIYSITNRTWRKTLPTKESRALAVNAAVNTGNRYVYLIGGWTDKFTLSRIDRFDTQTDTFSHVTDMGVPRYLFTSYYSAGNIYMVGGYPQTMNDISVYSIAKNQVSTFIPNLMVNTPSDSMMISTMDMQSNLYFITKSNLFYKYSFTNHQLVALSVPPFSMPVGSSIIHVTNSTLGVSMIYHLGTNCFFAYNITTNQWLQLDRTPLGNVDKEDLVIQYSGSNAVSSAFCTSTNNAVHTHGDLSTYIPHYWIYFTHNPLEVIRDGVNSGYFAFTSTQFQIKPGFSSFGSGIVSDSTCTVDVMSTLHTTL